MHIGETRERPHYVAILVETFESGWQPACASSDKLTDQPDLGDAAPPGIRVCTWADVRFGEEPDPIMLAVDGELCPLTLHPIE